MPPSAPLTTAALCEARMDAAINLLAAAIGAGWRQHSHMATEARYGPFVSGKMSEISRKIQRNPWTCRRSTIFANNIAFFEGKNPLVFLKDMIFGIFVLRIFRGSNWPYVTAQDPDLSALAELRKPRFEALVQLSKSISIG